MNVVMKLSMNQLSMNLSEVPKVRILLYLPNDNYEETLVAHLIELKFMWKI